MGLPLKMTLRDVFLRSLMSSHTATDRRISTFFYVVLQCERTIPPSKESYHMFKEFIHSFASNPDPEQAKEPSERNHKMHCANG
jgi:hypothetical protein